MKKTIVFTITTTPLGIASGLDKTEVVRADNSDAFSTKDGTLMFLVGENIIIYAPGTWAVVTSAEE